MAKVSLEIDVYKMTKQGLEHMLIEGYEIFVHDGLRVEWIDIGDLSHFAIVVDTGMGKSPKVYSSNQSAVKLFQAWEVVCKLC